MHLGPLTDLYGTPGAPKRAHFGPEWPFWGPGGPRRAPGGQIWSRLPPIGPSGLDSCSLTWYRAPSGPPGALKGPVLAQTPLLETLRFWEGLEGSDLVPDAPDCLAWIQLMVTTHFDLVSGPFRPLGTKSGPLGPSEVPNSTFYGQNRPFLPVFDRFLKLGGSIWAITVLDKQSIPLQCSGHPTSPYLKQKMSHTMLCR